jgi:glycosyltransferase involved in cell wall biosynthesis
MGIDYEHLSSLERLSSPSPSLLFLGRLVPVKGVDVLLRAVAAMDNAPGLIIAGDGPEKESLRRLADNLGVRADFVGEVRGEDKDRLLSEAGAVVLPSTVLSDGRTEGAPVVALEAMAAGVPVVASTVGGLAELPSGGARLVPPGDEAALATAIAQTLSAKNTPQILVGRSHARTRSWELVGPQLD